MKIQLQSLLPPVLNRSQALAMLVLTSVLWSTGGALIKLIQWNAPAIAATRSLIAAVLVIVVYKKTTITFSKTTIAAAVAYAATVMLFVSATKLTTAANAILLQYTAPIYVAMFSPWFLGERTRWSDWVVIGVVMVGMTLFFLDGLTVVNIFGNLTAMMSGFAFGWFALLMRKHTQEHTGEHDSLEPVLLGNILTACVGFPFAVGTLSAVSVQSWIGLVLLGVFQLGVSYILYVRAIRSVSALEAILIPIIEPLLNPVWALLLANEKPGMWAIVGGAIVISAITLRSVALMRFSRV
jgi:drug/metabolite transporter (DMT)-like permease